MAYEIDLSPGAVHVVERYPFLRTTYEELVGEGEDFSIINRQSWKPGHDYEQVSMYGDCDAVCDGFGKQILTVVSTHKPGRFPERVFYTRQWEDPDGNRFGKNACRIAVKSKFVRLTRGFGFGIDDDLQEVRLRKAKESEAA